MLTIIANDREARGSAPWPLTSGSVGLPVRFRFSAHWDGLSRLAVFRGSGTAADVALMEDGCTVPPQVLARPGGMLDIGVYGMNAAGSVVIPTVWARLGPIQEGAAPSGFEPAEPAPSWAAQVQSAAGEALSAAQSLRDDAAAGAFDGAPGVSPTVAVTTIPGGHRVTITDAAGAHPFDVLDGEAASGGAEAIYLTDSRHMNVTELQDAYAANRAILVRYYDTWPSQEWKWLYFTHYDSTSGEYYFRDLTRTEYEISYRRDGSNDVWTEAPVYGSYEDLWDLPEINGVELTGSKTPAQLGLVGADQGTANAGKFLVVGSDGIVAPVTIQAWSGGNY